MSPVVLKLNGFRFRSKVVAFDFDWTLVRPQNGRKFPKDVSDWEWLRPNVPDVIKQYYKKGWCIVIFTNQSKEWKVEQVRVVLSSLNIPVLAAIAMDKAEHKPSTVMWTTVVGARKVKTAESFFVGDALGRVTDWANTDLLFAQAIGIPAKSPEAMFPLAVEKRAPIPVKKHQEAIIMVGYPGSGKSSVAKELVAASAQYVIVDGDTLKTPAKMIKEMTKIIQSGKSPIIDATNPTKAGREKFMDVAHQHKLPVRCVWVTTSLEEAMLRNKDRNDHAKAGVPAIVYYVYRKKFEKPTVQEGFKTVVEL